MTYGSIREEMKPEETLKHTWYLEQTIYSRPESTDGWARGARNKPKQSE
jgi:hypothetical protein